MNVRADEFWTMAGGLEDLTGAAALPGDTQLGRMLGFSDPNKDLSPMDLVGSGPHDLGYLYRIRYAHPVAAQVMDDRRAAVLSLDYKLEPANATADASVASTALAEMFRRLPGYSLKQWIADVYDYTSSFGHALFEIVALDRYTYFPLYVPAFMVEEFRAAPTGLEFASVLLDNGQVQAELMADKASWYGNPAYPGNFWGIAATRKIQSLVVAQEQDILMYLQQQRMARGHVYIQGGEAGGSMQGWNAARTWQKRVYAGLDSPALFEWGLTPEVLQVQNPHLARAKEMFEYYDMAIRSVLGRHLLNLGMTGVGARALGAEVRSEQAGIWRQHVKSLLSMVNGDRNSQSTFLRDAVVAMGFDASLTPRVVAYEPPKENNTENIGQLALFAQSGWISPDDLSPLGMAKLIKSLGVEPKTPVPPEPIRGD